MKDNYPTRKFDTGKFINRIEPVAYEGDYFDYEENGYTIIEKFFDVDLIKKILVSDISGLITKEPGKNVVRAQTGIHENKLIKQLLKQELLKEIVTGILGSDAYIHQSRINYKSALEGSGWAWHSDFETWHAQDGMPGMRCVSAMIPLTENNECNGSLMVIPGSHNYFYSCKKEKEVSAEENFAYQKEGVPPNDAIMKFFELCGGGIKMIKCNPGDLVLFDCNTIHVSTSNLSPDPRTNIFFVFNSVENHLVNPFSASAPRPEEMGARKKITKL